MIGLFKKANKFLSEKKVPVMIDNIQLENTDKRSLNIKLNVSFEEYKKLVPLIKDNVKLCDDYRIQTIVDTAIDIVFSEIPDNIKDNIITKIINNTSPVICSLITDILKNKDISVEIDGIQIEVKA